MHFNGPDLTPADTVRLAGQLLRIFNLMLDGQPRTLAQIAAATNAPEGSVGAQLRNLRKLRFGGHEVKRKHLGGGLYEYRLIAPEPRPA